MMPESTTVNLLSAARALGTIGNALSSASSEHARVEQAVRILAGIVSSDAAVFYQRSTVRGAAPLLYAHSLSPYTTEQLTRGGGPAQLLESFVNIVAVDGHVRHAEIPTDTYFAREEGLHWASSFPVRSVGQVAGVLILAWRTPAPAMSDEEEAVCEAAASLIGAAIRAGVEVERGTEAAILRERARMARDIHDSVTQSITAIVLNLEAASRAEWRMPRSARLAIEESLAVARAALVDLRRSIWDLRMSDGIAQSMSERLTALAVPVLAAGIAIDVEVHGVSTNLPEDALATLASIAREALNNVLKHSAATRVELLVNIGQDQLTLAVTDNGVGATAPPGPGCFGISGMRERATSLGGTLAISGIRGAGTRLECTLPFARRS